MAGSKNPLEWVTHVQQDVTSGAAADSDRIQLLLDRDEVADIYKVSLTFIPDLLIHEPDVDAQDRWLFGCLLATDPAFSRAFITEANTKAALEDREVFAHAFWSFEIEVKGSVTADLAHVLAGPSFFTKETEFNQPLTVGGDIGMLSEGQVTTAAANGEMIATVYFRRRKSRNEKANLIMLRR